MSMTGTGVLEIGRGSGSMAPTAKCDDRSSLVRTDGRGDKRGPRVTEQDILYLGLPEYDVLVCERHRAEGVGMV